MHGHGVPASGFGQAFLAYTAAGAILLRSLMAAHHPHSAMLDHLAVGFDQHASEAVAAVHAPGQDDCIHEVTHWLSLLAAHSGLTLVCLFDLSSPEKFHNVLLFIIMLAII